MKEVKIFFDMYEFKNGKKLTEKNVFVASDEPSVLEELKLRYSQYKFHMNTNSSIQAAFKVRYKVNGALWNIIQDTYLLSQSDFLVCTFTSNICRLAMELMHEHYPDPTENVVSLDIQWFSFRWINPVEVSVLSHSPQNVSPLDLEFYTGDFIIRIGFNIPQNYSEVKH